MKQLITLLAVLGLGALSANASVSVLTFEGLKNVESINDFYNGGTGSLGSSGANYGISFTSDSLAIVSSENGGTGNFTGSLAPTPNTIAFFLTGAGDTMNVAGGFDTGFSFFYSSPFYEGSVNIWSGLNGTGTLLGSIALGNTTNTYPTTGHHYDDWHNVGVAFSGTAHSAIFTGVANYIGFDNITLGDSRAHDDDHHNVPDSTATLGLLGLALAGLTILRRR